MAQKPCRDCGMTGAAHSPTCKFLSGLPMEEVKLHLEHLLSEAESERDRWKAMHAAASEKERLANLQLGEVTAHRDCLRDMMNDVRRLLLCPPKDLEWQIMRRIEDGVVEKPKGAEGICPLCYHNYNDNDPAGKCPDHAEKRNDEVQRLIDIERRIGSEVRCDCGVPGCNMVYDHRK